MEELRHEVADQLQVQSLALRASEECMDLPVGGWIKLPLFVAQTVQGSRGFSLRATRGSCMYPLLLPSSVKLHSWSASSVPPLPRQVQIDSKS